MKLGYARVSTDQPRFSSGDAVRIVGVGFRVLDYWARTGLVCPQIEASGTGSERVYTLCDLVWLAVVKEFRALGVRPSIIRMLRSEFRKRPETLRYAVAYSEVSVELSKLWRHITTKAGA